MSVATEHPRTPWSVKPAFHVPGFHIMTPSIGGRTFRLFSSDHATAKEAQLAAAAPELLKALKVVCAILDMHRGADGDLPAFEDPCELVNDLEKDGVHELITDAIAKAEQSA